MFDAPVIVCLPIEDRTASYHFYREVLGLAAVGEPAEDGVPEPLQFDINRGLRLMLIPTGGFGWVIGDRRVADVTTSECVISLGVPSALEVDTLLGNAWNAGAVVTDPQQQPWGYGGTFADPDGHLWQVTAATD